MRHRASDDSSEGRPGQGEETSNRTEGGYPTTAEISPDEIDELRTFLETHDDATAYKVWYRRIGDGIPIRTVAEMSFVERTLERPAAAVTLECELLPPTEEPKRIHFDELDRVAVVDPPASEFEPRGDSPDERVTGFVGLARFAPERVPVAELVAALETDDSAVRESALRALDTLSDARPEDCVAALPTLRALLSEADHETDVLEIVATIADARPEDVAPLADEIATHLHADDESRALAARCLSAVAGHDPADVADAVPALEALVNDRGDGWPYALHALNRVAADHPERVRPAVPTLTEIVADAPEDDHVLLNATAALGRVSSEYPDAAVPALEDLLSLLTVDDFRVRANAAGVLSEIALGDVGALVPHVETIAPLLAVDDEHALTNTTATLSRIAEVDPEAVAHLTERFVDLLASEYELVRVNACWALGHLEAEAATEALEERRLTDDSEQVRNRAAWALVEIGSGAGSTADTDGSERP